jgi:hypothetical protein
MNQDNLNELFTWVVKAGSNRQYFLNIKQDKKGDLYLVIKESKRNAEGEKEIHRIMIFEKDLDNFVTGIKEVLHFVNNFEKTNFNNNLDFNTNQNPISNQNSASLATDLDDDLMVLIA